MAHVAVGEPVHVEGLAGAVPLRDGEAPVLRVDRDDLGDIAVVAGSGAIVAGELEAVAGAELGLGLGIGLGLIVAPSRRGPCDPLALPPVTTPKDDGQRTPRGHDDDERRRRHD